MLISTQFLLPVVTNNYEVLYWLSGELGTKKKLLYNLHCVYTYMYKVIKTYNYVCGITAHLHIQLISFVAIKQHRTLVGQPI